MAKATKSSRNAKTSADDIEDLNVAKETPEQKEAQVVTQTADDPPAAENDAAAGVPETPDSTEEIQSPEPAESRATPPRGGGFFPVFLGGVVAAVLGFAVAKSQVLDSVLPETWRTASASDIANLSLQMDEQAAKASEITRQLESLADPDMSEFEGAIAELTQNSESIASSIEATNANLAAMNTRLTTLEKQPIAEGVSQGAIDAYERELKLLQESVSAQRSEIELLLSDARAMEENAELTAQEALARAALTRVLSAIDSGGPFEAALNDLVAVTGIQPAEELAAVAQSGVTPMVQLQDSFPDASRQALSAARLAEPDSGNSVSAFFRRQLSARSVSPREGSDPDAVLSRAEAALKDGRLNDTLAEIETLPPEAVEAMSEWVARAESRRSAQNAAESLAQSLNSN